MLNWIRKNLTEEPDFPLSALHPEKSFYVIGDIHGQLDLLDRILAKCDPDVPVICVGDYVDRGDNSAGVLNRLLALHLHATEQMICLSGNHEQMLLSFLDNPTQNGQHWLRHGGLQTLASYGISDLSERSDASLVTTARDQLAKAMGDDLITWLKALPLFFQSGNVAVVHAGADPKAPIKEQSFQSLTWGHANFTKTRRTDGVWVVHGHTIVDQAIVKGGRISIDTGAYATGRLSAALIARGNIDFFTA